MATKQTAAQQSHAKSGRIVCSILDAPDCIDGIDFGLLPGEGDDAKPIRVSDVVPAEQAKRLLGIEGFAVYEGDEGDAAKAVEDARATRRETQPAATAAADIESLTKINLAMSEELEKANQRIAELEANAKGVDPKVIAAACEERDQRIALLENQAGDRDKYIATLEAKLPKD